MNRSKQAGMAIKAIVVLLVSLALASFHRAEAQQTGKVPRIGYLDNSTASGIAVLLEAFRQELTKLGWIEGKNITMEYRFAEQKNERLPELAAELVRLKVDLIVTSGTTPALAAKSANYYHPHRDGERWGPRGCRSGCQSGAAGRQCHRELGFINTTKHEKAGGTQGRGIQARPSWTSATVGRQHSTRPPTKRAQGCGSGTKAKIGGDRDSTRRQRLRERLSTRKAEAGGRDYADRQSLLFRRK